METLRITHHNYYVKLLELSHIFDSELAPL